MNWKPWLGFIGAVLILAYYANVHLRLVALPAGPVLDGVLALAFVYSFFLGATGQFGIWNAIRGEDGRASTSKFQVFLWTSVVVFAYVAIMGLRWRTGATQPLPDIPGNLLAALGISIGTATAAAAVTANNVEHGRESKGMTAEKGLAPIFQNDAGEIDLGKVQLVAWTFIAVAVFLALVFAVLASGSADASLPDIDPALMVLTGLGSAAYLGKKLVPTATPAITSRDPISVLPSAAAADRSVKLVGRNFGTAPGLVMIDNVALQDPTQWSDTTITFTVPATKPDTTAWRRDVPLDVTVSTTAGTVSNPVKLTLTQ